MSDTTIQPGLEPIVAPADVLRNKVLLHLGSNARAHEFAPLADGLIFRGSAGFGEARRQLQPHGTAAIDPELYATDRGREPNELVPATPQESVAAQLAAGVDFLLAPSRFPEQRDAASISRALDAGRAFIEAAALVAPGMPAFVPVVVRFDELESRLWVAPLVAAQLPVATVFAGFRDPLATPGAMLGAVEVIASSPHTIVLRCDLSIGGLMTHGALSGAIGTSSSVRHLWLPSRRRSAASADGHALIPLLNAWLRNRVVEAAAADPDLDEIFACSCGTCGPGGDVRQLMTLGVPDDGRAAMIERHSAHSAVMLVKKIVGDPNPRQAWADHLNACHERFQQLRDAGIPAEEPPMLAAWRDALGIA